MEEEDPQTSADMNYLAVDELKVSRSEFSFFIFSLESVTKTVAWGIKSRGHSWGHFSPSSVVLRNKWKNNVSLYFIIELDGVLIYCIKLYQKSLCIHLLK